MPRGDRTGPAGMGPMTGRRAGYCTGSPASGFTGPGPGPVGGGRGWRNMYYATGQPGWARAGYVHPYAPAAPGPSREQERDFLQQEAQMLKTNLDEIHRRLEELEKDE